MKHDTLTYKIATQPDEMEQIYQLNYETFVEEIPQHQMNEKRRLVDRFDQENNYIIAKDQEKVVGMIAVRANRPFSLDEKLTNLDDYLPKHANPCEIRLLSVKKTYRKTRVFYQLINLLVSYCLERKYTMALISGTDRQLRLYKKIGFEPFGPMVGNEGAMFQPMYLTKEKFETTSKAFSKLMVQKQQPTKPINMLPGPVAIKEEVVQAFQKTAISHRSNGFINIMNDVRATLCELVQANYAQVVVGTGTLANDLVAAQLKKLPGKGLIIANGEFGYRLIDHAKRMGLHYYTLEKQWNEKIEIDEIETIIKAKRDIEWLWTVHCETSTGYLYDLDQLVALATTYQMKVCLDACSTVGVIPVQLENVFLASTVSGKGLGAYPGLAIVFHRDPITASTEIPRYLDLGQYASNASIPYTHSSNLIFALSQAMKHVDYRKKSILSTKLKQMLLKDGLPFLGDETYSPGIITVPLPTSISSKEIGDELQEKGILVSYKSDYLLERNWIQFTLMGEITLEEIETVMAIFKKMIPMTMKHAK